MTQLSPKGAIEGYAFEHFRRKCREKWHHLGPKMELVQTTLQVDDSVVHPLTVKLPKV
jgi:hypothetical protein